MKCYTFWQAVKNKKELSKFLEKTGDLPGCEMFKYKKQGDQKMIKRAGFIATETCDEEIFNEIPNTLKEALGYDN